MRCGLSGRGEGGVGGDGGGRGTTVKRSGAELPPPGGGFWTTRFRTIALPVFSKGKYGTTVVIVVELTRVAGKTESPKKTFEPIRKLEPAMVTVTEVTTPE